MLWKNTKHKRGAHGTFTKLFCPSANPTAAPMRRNHNTANPCFPILECCGTGQSQVKRLQIAFGLHRLESAGSDQIMTFAMIYFISAWNVSDIGTKKQRLMGVICNTPRDQGACLQHIVHIVHSPVVSRFRDPNSFIHSAHGETSFNVHFFAKKPKNQNKNHNK